MKYRFYGDTLQLVKYDIETEEGTFTAVSDSERDSIMTQYPDAKITPIDNTGYEYLDGEIFTQEQRSNGEVEAAIAMGAEAYEAMRNAPTQNEINAMLLLQMAELTAEVKGNE